MKPISSYHNYLYESREFADVTLVSDDYHPVETHKTLLAHSSTIFRSLLYLSTDQKPIIYLKGVSHKELLALIKYIYLVSNFVGDNCKVSGLIMRFSGLLD